MSFYRHIVAITVPKTKMYTQLHAENILNTSKKNCIMWTLFWHRLSNKNGVQFFFLLIQTYLFDTANKHGAKGAEV